MTPETRQCQSCKANFVIEPDDFAFCEKMQVAPPTWCFSCTLQRRLSWRNEQHLHKRACAVPGHSEQLISMYSEEGGLPAYDKDYWWSDAWDPMEFGNAYDETVPFMKQAADVIKRVPLLSLNNYNAINSDYCNYTTDNKNCYLVYGGDYNEDCMYSSFPMYSKSCADVYWTFNGENCYELIDTEKCYNVRYGRYLGSCVDSMFLYNCTNVSNCIACANIQNKQYCIFNQQYSKEEYTQKVKELKLDTYSGIEALKAQFEDFILNEPRRYAHNIKAVDSTGQNLYEAKNCKNCFDVAGPAEDLKDIFLAGLRSKDGYRSNHFGHGVEQIYESFGLFEGTSKAIASCLMSSSSNAEYSFNCRGCTNIMGCSGLRSKSYCILNKQYSKEEYEALREKIVQQMKDKPYVDALGRSHTYGDFFATELSPFGYNETVASEYYPLSKIEATERGYQWYEGAGKKYEPTIQAKDLPQTIAEVDQSVLKEIIGCEHEGACAENCTSAFRVTATELEFYKRFNIPLPHFCPNCRHARRIKQRPPLRLWKRKCHCAGAKSDNGVYVNTAAMHQSHALDGHCPNEFETTYAPDRKEIVYCEQCYQAEIL